MVEVVFIVSGNKGTTKWMGGSRTSCDVVAAMRRDGPDEEEEEEEVDEKVDVVSDMIGIIVSV